jgi:iron complex outermembrane receptor protein
LAAEVLPGDVVTTEVIANVGKARLYGIDADVAAAATEHLSLQAAMGYLRAYYLDSAFAITGIERNTPLPKAPKWTESAAVEYRLSVKGDGVTLRADYGFTSANYPDVRATPALKQKAHGLVNARIAWASRDERWDMALYGKNIFDTRFIQNGFDARDSQGSILVIPNDPREIGLQVGGRF